MDSCVVDVSTFAHYLYLHIIGTLHIIGIQGGNNEKQSSTWSLSLLETVAKSVSSHHILQA